MGNAKLEPLLRQSERRRSRIENVCFVFIDQENRDEVHPRLLSLENNANVHKQVSSLLESLLSLSLLPSVSTLVSQLCRSDIEIGNGNGPALVLIAARDVRSQ